MADDNQPSGELVQSFLCEVVSVEAEHVKIRIRLSKGYIAQRTYPRDKCPEAAQIAGGAFYIDKYHTENGINTYKVRPVDEAEEREELKKLLGPDEE